MYWKKTKCSYLFWGIYTVLTTAVLCNVAVSILASLELSPYLAFPAAAILLGWCGCLALLLHKISGGNDRFEFDGFLKSFFAGVLVAVFVGIGIWLRIRNITDVAQTDFVRDALMTAGYRQPSQAHGAAFFYVSFLHEIFFLFGNHLVPAAIIQAIVQVLGFVVFYFGVRILYGRLAGLISMAILCFSQGMIEQSTRLDSPINVYFLFLSVCFTLICAVSKLKYTYVSVVVSAVIAGLATYLDASGLVLVALAIAVIFKMHPGKKSNVKKSAVLNGITVLTVAVTYVFAALIDSLSAHKAFAEILVSNLALMKPSTFFLSSLQMKIDIAVIIASVLACMGVFAFWRRSRRENLLPLAVMSMVTVLLVGFAVMQNYMKPTFLIVLFFAVAAGRGLVESIAPVEYEEYIAFKDEKPEEPVKAEAVVEKTEKQLKKEQKLAEKQALKQAKAKEKAEKYKAKQIKKIEAQLAAKHKKENKKAGIEEKPAENTDYYKKKVDETTGEPIKYLENPLPLPKKSVKRANDYAITDISEFDDYDIEVADDDDFDYE